eukprot:78544_1
MSDFWLGSLIALLALIISIYMLSQKSTTTDERPKGAKLKVLALNTWDECTKVQGGFDALVDVIIQTNADIVLLSEIKYNGKIFSERIVHKLKKNGHQFYSYDSKKSPLILSKFPIDSIVKINCKQLTKCKIKLHINNKIATIVLYAAHLDAGHYACYLPRGYDGKSWKPLPNPVLDINKILTQNKQSKRSEAIDIFIKDALKEKENGNIIIIGGDFNEPSHLDWINTMKNKFDHNGVVINWPQSTKLLKYGFIDCYRKIYSNPVEYPGITYPAYNKDVELEKLGYADQVDERERIDFIYYYKDKRIDVIDVVIVGPIGCVVNGKIVETNPGNDKFIMPKMWPTDHKAILATFNLT